LDSIRISNPKEWQALCQRVILAFNPNKECIPTAFELRRRIKQGMSATGNMRAFGFLRGGGPELIFRDAIEGKLFAQKILGWIKPWEKRPFIVKPAVKKWLAPGYRHLITSYEWSIVLTRQKLRELGVRLKPYSSLRIRKMEEQYLREIGWKLG
jgi:hypothetical protein